MIHSMLDNDLYKFTMQQAVCKLYPRAVAQYEFINRGRHAFPDGFDKRLEDEISVLAMSKLTSGDHAFLERACPFLDPVYLDFLRGFKFDPEHVTVGLEDGDLSITILGPWYKTILWEVPIMAMISELCFVNMPIIGAIASLDRKIETLEGISFADFGTRRRFSRYNQMNVVKHLQDLPNFVGTSNLALSREFGIKPIGTMAHEWIMAHGAMYGYQRANREALDKWVEVYRGELGIALTDTYGTANFFDSFDLQLSKLFDGVRHDSGCPFQFLEEVIAHYTFNGIDPTSKTIVFSDGLNPEKVVEIEQRVRGRIQTSYGIGTNLTNDVGSKPVNMVIKMTGFAQEDDGVGFRDAVKLSDEPGKHTGNLEEIELCKKTLKLG